MSSSSKRTFGMASQEETDSLFDEIKQYVACSSKGHFEIDDGDLKGK